MVLETWPRGRGEGVHSDMGWTFRTVQPERKSLGKSKVKVPAEEGGRPKKGPGRKGF